MLGFVARRLLHLLPVLLAVSLLTFLIASLLPGDLAYVILGDQATPDKVEALRHDMGLDQPIWWRYLGWLGHVLEGDFGRSFRTGQTVLQAVAERLPVSFELIRLIRSPDLIFNNYTGVPMWRPENDVQISEFGDALSTSLPCLISANACKDAAEIVP